ncbi:MAG: phytanoyl-CoA dioxygenase family protein, partial [Candidatus Latescibacteria bacterium]|nr:phytanoyl-CoA dioxygenase family protein [Candidatus Latescibacterota bacterium]
MSFTFSERHISDYYHHGYTVFRGILPPSLIRDLRRVTDRAREITREERGPQAQRLQPIGAYEERLDLQPFREYLELLELNDALQKVLSPEHSLAGLPRMGVFFEPAERPWCTVWHRDITERTPGVEPEEFHRITRDPTFFTQINCALYTDVCTWYVPGSDSRPDVLEEVEAARQQPNPEGRSDEECERLNLAYCQGMP